MSIQVSRLNSIPVYDLSHGKSLNQFLHEAAKKKKSLRYNKEYRNRLELIQDFEFPGQSQRIRVSKDGNYIAATGSYPPQVKIFETDQLTVKCIRNLDAEILQFLFLSDDYKKLIFLCDNRQLEFHAQYGKHYITRIPKFGRDMAFDPFNSELYIVGASSEVYRLNLEHGRFLSSIESNINESFNVTDFNREVQQIIAFGGEEGLVECWDTRQKERAAVLDSQNGSISALKFDQSGLYLGVGHDSGIVQLYDIRRPNPLYQVTHYNELPIKSLQFHQKGFLLSADPKVIKIVKKDNGEIHTNIESEADLNSIEVVGNTGLIFAAREHVRVGQFFIPSIGPPPKWASFLENLTEELEETPNTNLYENKKFVTREELEQINADSYIGTEHLEAYMHGYLIDLKLYYKHKQLSEPFIYEQYKKTRVQEKLEEARSQRITVKKKLPKVNKDLAQNLQEVAESGSKRKQQAAQMLLQDDRFTDLFTNPEFVQDIKSEEFKRYNPQIPNKRQRDEDSQESEQEDVQIISKKQRKAITEKKTPRVQNARRTAVPTQRLLKKKK